MTSPPWLVTSLLLAGISTVLWAWRAVGQVVTGAEWISWQALLPNLAVAVMVGLIAGTATALVAAAAKRRVAWVFVASWSMSAVLLATMGAAAATRGWWLITVVALVAVPIVGLLLGSLVDGRPGSRLLRSGLVSAVALAVLGSWLSWPGPSSPEVATESVRVSRASIPQIVPDPTTQGPHHVKMVRYGSGKEGIQPAYGPSVDVRTPTVDASEVVQEWSPALTQAWGFDATSLPLNATVWRPDGAGSFPLVLVVHGNATAGSSELGFAYLGEILASRGYVVASIDENFLNTGVIGGRTQGLDAARAWLVLQHLRQWSTWSGGAAGSSPVAGLIDLSRVTLIGHSRGGEAVAVAAAMNSSSAWPGMPRVTMNFGFPISTVIAIAPSNGIYEPGGEPVTLHGVNYLTFAGSYDADIRTFAGSRQYARTSPGPGQVKAAIALSRMNHNQFNSLWGRYDAALGLAKHVLSTGVLVSPENQRRVALGYVSGFLDLTVRNQAVNVSLFDGSATDVSFAQGIASRQQFATGDTTALKAGHVTGGEAETVKLPTRIGKSNNSVTHLTGSGTVRQKYVLSDGAASGDRALRVDLADAAPAGSGGIVKISLEVTDPAGKSATLPLGVGEVHPSQLPGQFTKAGFLMPTPSSEPVLTTYTVPMTSITEAGILPARVTAITLVVHGSATPGLYVDNVVLVGKP